MYVDAQCHVNTTQAIVSKNLLHKRLGHRSRHAMICLLPHISFNSSIALPDFCDGCQYEKMYQLSLCSTRIKSSTLLELIDTDLWR